MSAIVSPGLAPATAYRQMAQIRATEERFCALDARHADAFTQRGSQWHMNLARVAELQLTALGVINVSVSGICVHSDAENFFSYRRDGETGRMAAMVWIEGDA